jgi:hypothetical protein
LNPSGDTAGIARLVNGPRPRPGVLGAVAVPAWRRAGLSVRAPSTAAGEVEDVKRGGG